MSRISPVLLVGLVLAGAVSVSLAAGGIKGLAQESQQRLAAVKGPRAQQQQYLPPPPPPPPQPLPLPPLPPRPLGVKGPGQAVPVFSAARVQPILPPPPPPVAPIVQQQQQQEVIVQQQQQQQEQEPESNQQQQLQQEVDPNAAAQDPAPAIAVPNRATSAAASEEEANPRPEPYAFNYAFEAGDSATSGSSQREEQQDASGRVTGFYTIRGEDGRDRRVDYVADANGFRATISTNEMGTAPKDSADVDWNAQNPTDAQLRVAESATQAARQRALLNPQPASAASASSFAPSKISSPRQNAAAAAASTQQQQVLPAKGRPQAQQQQQIVQQLQEPFEQIRQTELNSRARKSRHAPFYLFTV